MATFKMGVLIDSFRVDLRSALGLAQKIGVSGIQIYSTNGDTAPENLTAEKRRALLDLIKSHGLIVSALCGDLGSGGFTKPEANVLKIERSKRILELAKDLETDIVTTHIGVVPEDPAHPRYQILQDACGTLAEYADSLRAHFAIETGPEPARTLKTFLDSLHSRGVAVNLDPANFVMVTGDDPADAVHTLKDYIVHTHAKDGRKLYHRDPEEVYGMVESHIVTSPSYAEVPLGEGQVDWDAYLAALTAIGYDSFLTIEREVGGNPYEDIAKAYQFLIRKIES
ncbi:MAG: sugar phosphate isomerase/epimerase [Oscillospiraceae bacterium]|jgi:sugar phosphate isomerase/epimerase|nr:sugar phosphate isomerase/epimerase [Oscillospiraceae bacterium]